MIIHAVMPSTVVAEISYDKPSHTLRVIYASGMIYEYKNVPEQIYADMKTAFSKGIFLNKHIKGKYEFVKVED